MNLVLVWLGRILKLVLFLALIMLLFALAWTLIQIASLADTETAAGTTTSRRDAYIATATAMDAEDETASLRVDSRIVLIQQNAGSPIPEATQPAGTPPTPVATATPEPEDFSLPKLLVPLDPDEGKWLSGMLVPRRVPQIHRENRLINFILLGSDEELTSDNFIRTDTMIIVSLNTETSTVSMFSLPRDLFVYIPHGRMGRLNTAFGIGENLNWDPGRGFGLLRQTIFYNFGINVHYYARVNFSGFEAIIDRLGGVDIAVDCAYRDLYPVNRKPSGENSKLIYRWRTLDVGYYTFSGFDALWYARTRKYTDDLDRGRRQQLLLRAMWRKARSQGLVTTLPGLWGELIEIVDTDVPFDLMLRLLPHLVNLDLGSIENFTFHKRYHTTSWTTADGSSVLLPVAETVADLMQDFYTPPSRHQAALTGPSIAVYNGSGLENWDIVASERLRWNGYNAVALGPLDDGKYYSSNALIDNVATEKGSLAPRILRALNMTEEQATRDAKADREFDYQVIIGRDYKSCTFGVLPLDG